MKIFSPCGKNGKIKNLGIGGDIKGYGYVSGLVSRGDDIEIYNCYNNCNLKGNYNVGGILADRTE